MKKVTIAFLILACCSFLRADLLDDVSRQLDLLEEEYWLSQYSQEGEYRDNVEKRLRDLAGKVNRIVMQLRKARQLRVADIASPANSLVGEFGKIRAATIKRFNFSFSGTSMRDYTRSYRAYVREQEALKAEEAEKSEKGTKRKRRSRSRASRAVPTLANVDIVEYERWLAEQIAANMDKFLSRKNNGNSSERSKVNDAVNTYMTAIKNFRISLVKIRQQTKIKFQ